MIEVLILLFSFLILLAMGVPIAYSIGLASLFTVVSSMDSVGPIFSFLMGDLAFTDAFTAFAVPFTTVAQRMGTGLDSFALLAIPFFILAGQLMNFGGIASRLINFAKSLIGFLPGGLGHVNIVANMLFGAISGSAVAAASAIGGVMHDRMVDEGFDPELSASVNISSATTGMIIPPSNILIVYSLASGGASIGALFVAGYIPGFLVGLALMLVTAYFAIKRGYPTEKISSIVSKIVEIFKTFIAAIPSLLLLIIVIGGIIAGVFTATEASAVAVAYALVLGFIYKEIKVGDLPKILLNSVNTTSIVMILIATSMAMSWVMAFENIPQSVSEALLSISNSKIVVLLIINLILLFVGVFMDMTPAVLIFTPIFLPVVTAPEIGLDPIHFGIIMVMNLCIGICTPPVGSVLFVGSAIAKVRISEVIRPLMPFFIAMVIVLLLVTYIPALSMWLPNFFEF